MESIVALDPNVSSSYVKAYNILMVAKKNLEYIYMGNERNSLEEKQISLTLEWIIKEIAESEHTIKNLIYKTKICSIQITFDNKIFLIDANREKIPVVMGQYVEMYARSYGWRIGRINRKNENTDFYFENKELKNPLLKTNMRIKILIADTETEQAPQAPQAPPQPMRSISNAIIPIKLKQAIEPIKPQIKQASKDQEIIPKIKQVKADPPKIIKKISEKKEIQQKQLILLKAEIQRLKGLGHTQINIANELKKSRRTIQNYWNI